MKEDAFLAPPAERPVARVPQRGIKFFHDPLKRRRRWIEARRRRRLEEQTFRFGQPGRRDGCDRAFEKRRPFGEKALDAVDQSALEVRCRRISLDPRHAEAHQHGANILVLAFDGLRAPSRELFQREVPVRFHERISAQPPAMHIEIVGDDQVDFRIRPVAASHLVGHG
ncbi:hypothetical protein ACFQI3_05100 [Hansschlegelia quercus]|uniref:hypothetical protein n=1 Tax=Hansschlegelia quercus TaxID=2528245 RepID=UPI001FDFE8F7|nr:hypothetical protein [Hansschlegelia quercus]